MEYKCNHRGYDRAEIVENIEKHHCHIVMVIGDHLPGFAYSIGLFESFGHPEIICFGMDLSMMAELINDACDSIKQGNTFGTYIPYPDFLEGVDVKFVTVDQSFYGDYFNFAINYYGDENFPAMQMVWPDKENKFPWEENFYEPWKFQQPLLDRNTDFKFYEPHNLCVFTTQTVIEGQPVLYVYHDTDGEWQFHSTDDITDEEPLTLSLESVVKLDSSINQLYDLKPGWYASRNDKESEWVRLEFEED